MMFSFARCMIDESLRYAEFFSELFREPTPQFWRTPHRVVFETESLRLLDFSTSHSGKPTVIFPPQAGGHSNIADYENASLVQVCLGNGREHLYCVDFKPASQNNNQKHLDDLVWDAFLVVGYITIRNGRFCNIIGLCQGVWLSVIFGCLYPHFYDEMVLVAGPVDFHADPDNTIYSLVKNSSEEDYDKILAVNGGIWPGDLQHFLFKMLDYPKKVVASTWDIYHNIRNEEWLERNRRFRNWFENRQDLGGWVKEAGLKLFRDNLLVKGGLNILGRNVDLCKLHGTIKLLYADRDDITSPSQLTSLIRYAPNTRCLVYPIWNCGHIGAFNSWKSLGSVWPCALRD